MLEEAKVKEILEEILKTSDVDASYKLFYDFEEDDTSDFFEENEETLKKLIDCYIEERVLTIGQLYCLLLIKFKDERYEFMNFLDGVNGKNQKSAKLLKMLLKMVGMRIDEVDYFENNLSVFEKAMEEYVKNFS